VKQLDIRMTLDELVNFALSNFLSMTSGWSLKVSQASHLLVWLHIVEVTCELVSWQVTEMLY